LRPVRSAAGANTNRRGGRGDGQLDVCGGSARRSEKAEDENGGDDCGADPKLFGARSPRQPIDSNR
jgi:hypothetical protein